MEKENAVLFIHGILGTPHHFDFLREILPEGFTAKSLLLTGHGGSTRDFGKSSMAQWMEQCESALLELGASHKRVFLVGHSMGSLLAVHLALVHPDKVSGIFALAIPLRIRFGIKALASSLHSAFAPPETDSPFQRVCRDACSVRLSKNPFAYLPWIPRFLELFALSREIRKAMPNLKVSCKLIQSSRDELVSTASARFSAGAEILFLPESFHYFYSEKDLGSILKEWNSFIAEHIERG